MIDNGAVYQQNGVICDVGSFDDIRRRYVDAPVVGNGRHIILPGFVNAHHHVGLTPLQLGIPDMPTELWSVARIGSRKVDPYLDTLYSAFEMIASGTTTVQHIRALQQIGSVKQAELDANEVIRAYEDVGMRVSYSLNARDQHHLGHLDENEFIPMLPPELQRMVRSHLSSVTMSLDDNVSTFDRLYSNHSNKNRVKVQLAPANLHWCSDRALEMFAEVSKKYLVPMHMHLLETPYQREYAYRRGGVSAIDYLSRFDFLGPRLTLGHAVWTSESDIEKIAATGTHVCHNCSSNFRLRNGIAPLNRFEQQGINVAIGIDEAGINDDRDMLQELRLALRAHSMPGPMDDPVLTCSQVLRMATIGGAMTTPFAKSIGALEVGRGADFVVIDWDKLTSPFLDPLTSVVDAVVQRAKTDMIDLVIVEGEIIYDHGRFVRVDYDEIIGQLEKHMERAPDDGEIMRRHLSKNLLPYVKHFYTNYVEWNRHVPFYRPNSYN
jgi:cytosine/adenosine deaminase-related metal-dependent hydrolase